MISRPDISQKLAPADAAAVAEAVRSAGSQGNAIYPVGGGTRSDCGVATLRPGVILSLENLNRVIDYPADDMTITVEAGLTIGELNRRLAAHRQRLPVDVPQPERATVGGAVALNAAGPRRYGYGTIRDYVLGFTAVDGSGATFSGGGRVVKNAAGYNMARLMTGSLGTLGILTQVTLMVRPLCEASALLACDLPQFDVAEQLLAGLVRSATRPVAIELLAGQPRNDHALLCPAVAGSVRRLLVGFEGPAAEVDWMVGQLRQEWKAAGVVATAQLSAADCDSVWQQLTETPGNAQLGVEIHVLPSATVATVGKLLKIAPDCIVQAHAGNGVICVGLPYPLGKDGQGGAANASAEPAATRIVRQLREIATAAGGKMVVTQHPSDVQLAAADIWGPPSPLAGVMQAIKDRFDPQNILNPGRFVFA